MRSATKSSATRGHDPIQPDSVDAPLDGAFSRALSQGLNLPLSALRATMESLGQELARSGVAPLRITGVLREVERLAENVRGLCDFASPPVPRPLRCSIQEILESARRELAPEQRPCIVTAQVEPGIGLDVDGPLLSSCLRRLMENALEAGCEHVLLVSRLEPESATFSVIDDAPRAFDPAWALEAFHTTKPNRLGLGLALTRRDVQLMDGRLEFLSTPGGETCARIAIPVRPEEPR